MRTACAAGFARPGHSARESPCAIRRTYETRQCCYSPGRDSNRPGHSARLPHSLSGGWSKEVPALVFSTQPRHSARYLHALFKTWMSGGRQVRQRQTSSPRIYLSNIDPDANLMVMGGPDVETILRPGEPHAQSRT